jgi:uncharacterized protein YecE (DUF72 family)
MSIQTDEGSSPVRAGGTVLIGTSGWSYRSWRGPFFPDDLPAHLEYTPGILHYGTEWVFYRTPSEESVAAHKVV